MLTSIAMFSSQSEAQPQAQLPFPVSTPLAGDSSNFPTKAVAYVAASIAQTKILEEAGLTANGTLTDTAAQVLICLAAAQAAESACDGDITKAAVCFATSVTGTVFYIASGKKGPCSVQ